MRNAKKQILIIYFKNAWIMDFKGNDVIPVMDADDAGRKGTRDIARRFIQAWLPTPRQQSLDQVKDLNELNNKTRRES